MRKRIAIPTSNAVLDVHFGHCREFTFLEVTGKKIQRITRLFTPPHAPGRLPQWLEEKGTTHVIASSMGRQAQELLLAKGIQVHMAAPEMDPEGIVEKFLEGSLDLEEEKSSSSHCLARP